MLLTNSSWLLFAILIGISVSGTARGAGLPPKTRVLAATNVGHNAAHLTGMVKPNGRASVWFEWGVTNVKRRTAPRTLRGTNWINIGTTISNLLPSQKYYYRLAASNQFGIRRSAVTNFTTQQAYPPMVRTLPLPETDISYNQLWLLAEVNTQGYMSDVWFECGGSPAAATNIVRYWTLLTAAWEPRRVVIRDLRPNTIYYYRLVASNHFGISRGEVLSARTKPGFWTITKPAEITGSTSAKLYCEYYSQLGNPTELWFEWGLTTNYGNMTPPRPGDGRWDDVITGLAETETLYHFRAVASNEFGIVYGADQTFTTPLFPEALNLNLPDISHGSAAWGDYDNDGGLDIVMGGTMTNGSNVCSVWRNLGSGFLAANTTLPTNNGRSLAWGDYDNDGRLDLLIGAPPMEIWRNSGMGFSKFGTNSGPGGLSPAIWGDFNNDGRPDIASLGLGPPGGAHIYFQTAGGFAGTSLGPYSTAASSVAAGDFDNDGWLDLLSTGAAGGPMQLWRNQATNFSLSLPGIGERKSGSLDWGDYDNDGRLDMLVTGLDELTCAVWRNTVTGFTKIDVNFPRLGGAGAFDSLQCSAQWGDYDNDGRLDILLYGYGGYIMYPHPWRDRQEYLCQIWRNTGSGFTNINAGIRGLWYGSAAWGDYDNDGRLDVLQVGLDAMMWGSGLPMTRIYRNLKVRPNTPPTAPRDLAAFETEHGLALTWAAASDAETPSSGLTYNVRAGTSPGAEDLLSAQALLDGRRLLPAMGNTQMRRFAYLVGLTNGQRIYWSVQAVDTGFMGGPFAPEQTLVYPPGEWPKPRLEFAESTGSNSLRGVRFRSGLPLPFSVYGSTNLVDWEWLGTASEGTGGEFRYQETNAPAVNVRFYQLRSP